MKSSTIPVLWRLRLVMHGVRISPLVYDDAPAPTDGRRVAWQVEMDGPGLTGAEEAPLDARVNIRAASFVLRAFDLHAAEILADADGGLLAISEAPVCETPQMQVDRVHGSRHERQEGAHRRRGGGRRRVRTTGASR